MPLSLLPNSLRYLDAVARLGSIQAASRDLLISASAINRQILMLEDAAGIRLFDRHASGMKPTRAGEMLVALARRWRNDGNDVWSELQTMLGVESGQLRIAVMDSLVNSILPDFVDRMGRNYPLVQIDLEIMSPSEAARAIKHGRMDLALAFNVRPQRDLQIVWSETLPLGCITTPDHPLASEPDLTLQKVTEFPLVLQSPTLAIRQLIELEHDWLIHESRQPVITNSLQLLKILVARGTHVGLSSELDNVQEILDGRIVFLPIGDAGATMQSVSLLTASTRSLSTVAQTVAALLVRIVQEHLTRIRSG